MVGGASVLDLLVWYGLPLTVAVTFFYLVRIKPMAVWIIAIALVIAGTWSGIENTREWTWANRSTALIYGVSAVQALFPVCVIMGLVYATLRIKSVAISLTVTIFATIAFLIASPFIALVIVCWSGLDCI